MTNTHFVDDDVLPLDESADPHAWPLEALATAPLRPLDALVPQPRQRHFRSVYPHEERIPQTRVDVRDEQGWG